MAVALPCIAQFVIVLDVTIVAIALPALQADLGMSTAALGWVITAYTLMFGGCLLTAGRLADRIGRRRTFAGGLVVFAGASLGCGLAPTGALLLAGRALQGIGAALVSPAALALITCARPSGPARARALGWWTAAAAGGGASGWVLGGVLSGLLDWRWVFLVNVPICLAAAALVPRLLDEGVDGEGGRLDLPGALLVTVGIGALVLALTLVQTGGPWLAAAVVAAVLAPALARRTARALRARPAILGPNLVAATLTATTTPPMLFCVLHAQDVLGLSPVAAGLLFPPFNLAVIAGSLAGPHLRRGGMAGGLLAVAAGAVALLAIDPDAPALPSMLGGFLLMGAGLGVASVASTERGTAALEGGDQGLASGLLATSAQLGTALGLAIMVPVAERGGYERGFVTAAACAAAAAIILVLAWAASRARPRSASPPAAAPAAQPPRA